MKLFSASDDHAVSHAADLNDYTLADRWADFDGHLDVMKLVTYPPGKPLVKFSSISSYIILALKLFGFYVMFSLELLIVNQPAGAN
ncbi:hypothetical protein C9383_02060 [Pseudomonas palleroniana]|uniref:Uncharacterized protein n=1 Tax=Pseudomonas palleroniana TaxID=191390 RepID=A0A1H5G9J0_9PSED|nr:hypothetical protein [Pseudomonas palleroniana]KAB0565137.1 hypothetical protein F7R03_19180 [Pseudomonas palleroniana]PTC31816.1 hypothetical protein C9383_02060 [Pseudomonas palleroniana]SEE12299.1 hypothetical protein SAMN04490198_0592 [Pseudomonas palleroniana]